MMAYVWRLRRDRKGKGIPLVEVYERILKFVISEWCTFMALKKSRKLRC